MAMLQTIISTPIIPQAKPRGGRKLSSEGTVPAEKQAHPANSGQKQSLPSKDGNIGKQPAKSHETPQSGDVVPDTSGKKHAKKVNSSHKTALQANHRPADQLICPTTIETDSPFAKMVRKLAEQGNSDIKPKDVPTETNSAKPHVDNIAHINKVMHIDGVLHGAELKLSPAQPLQKQAVITAKHVTKPVSQQQSTNVNVKATAGKKIQTNTQEVVPEQQNQPKVNIAKPKGQGQGEIAEKIAPKDTITDKQAQPKASGEVAKAAANTETAPPREIVPETHNAQPQKTEKQTPVVTGDKDISSQLQSATQATNRVQQADEQVTDVPARPVIENAAVIVEASEGKTSGETSAVLEVSGVNSIQSSASADSSQAPVETARPEQLSTADQVIETVRLSGNIRTGQRVVIRLDPPELGQVRLVLRTEGRGVRGILEVENPRALAQLRSATPPMIQRLAESGVQMNRLDVVLNNSTSQNASDAGDSQMQNNAFAQGQSQGQDGSSSGQPGRNDSQENTQEFEQNYGRDEEASYVSDDAINVWI